MKKNAGFTLIEIIIVIVIISVLIGLSVPNLQNMMEKTRSREGIQILEALRKAQWAYFYENDSTFADDANNLGAQVVSADNFDTPPLALSTTNPTDIIASVARSTGAYTLHITGDGNLTCTPGGAVCNRLELP